MCSKFLVLAMFVHMALANPFGTKQSVTVSGHLKCQGKPSVGTKVKLYDNDHFTIDDLMAQSKTDNNGHFKMSGTAKEITNIDPKLNLYHNCKDEFPPPCKWKVTIKVPKSYIGQHAKVFDIGTLNLEGKFSGQNVDCFN
ncbi:hypothetical protein niasHS_013677 [Heterodera schachtii]|uniref:Transthyretin-like family protein n=1 Tax=Heterodera schachtii TaxID=97005 RepID=A0ABD2IE77_HETSC